MLNVDIIDMIIKILNSECRSGDLLSTALSCRLFSEIALDLLWYEMDDIDPLLRLLPGVVEIDSDLVIQGALTDAGCSRFWHYSRRIRELCISGYATGSRYHHVYMQLQLYVQRRGLDILPSLERFEYDRSAEDSSLLTLEFLLFLSTKLTTLEVYTPSAEHSDIRAMVWAVVDRCSTLRDFQIEHAPSDILTTLLQLASLEALALQEFPVSPELFSFLRRSPKLVKLDIGQRRGADQLIDHPSQMLALPKDLLPSLKVLGLRMYKHDALYLLHHISSKSLELIELQIQAVACLSIMEAISMFTSLTLVDLSFLSDMENNDNPIDILTVIRPLLSLPHISEFAIYVHYAAAVTITTDTIRAIASSWKHLKTLIIAESGKPSMTGVALEIIASHCPNLLELQIELDLTDLTHDDLPESPTASMLSVLNLSPHTIFNDVDLVNKFVGSLFPYLKKYGVYDRKKLGF